MLRGDYAREVARDLWFWLRHVLNDLRYPCDDERAAQLTRQLCYLCTHYNTETLSDCHQGMAIDATWTSVTSSPAACVPHATKEDS